MFLEFLFSFAAALTFSHFKQHVLHIAASVPV